MKKIIVYLLYLVVLAAISNGGTLEYEVVSDNIMDDILDGSLAKRDIQQLPEELLPEGISKLYILAYRTPTDEQDVIYFVGEDNNGVLYDFGMVIFNGVMNIAKTDVLYREDGYIYIISQQPYTAFYYKAKYEWDPNNVKLILIEEKSGDPSLDTLEEVEGLLNEGEIEEAGDKLLGIFYPGRYFSDYEMAVKFLRAADKSAERLSNHTTSYILIEEALNAFQLTLGSDWVFQFDSREEYVGSHYGEYMDFSEFKKIMRSYGGYLERAGKEDRAEELYEYLDGL